jgi:hypothetical protein
MKCPSLHLWFPRGYPAGEDNHEPRTADTPATLSPPLPTADHRRSGRLPSYSRSARTRSGRRRHRGGHPARCQSPHRPRWDRYLSTSSRPRFLGHPSQHRPAPGMGRGCPSDLAGVPGATTGSLRLPGHGLDHTVAPNSSGSLGFDRLLRCHPAPAVACLGLRLETAALRPGSGPAAGREDATDPPIHQRFGAARRRPVRGRDRPLAVPAVARLLGSARRRRRGLPERRQREASDHRRTQPLPRNPAVPGAEDAVERRFPGVPRADPSAVPRMAGVAGVGRGQQSYGPGVAARREKLRNPPGLVAGPMSRAEPDGSPVAPWQGANLCQPAV